MAVGRAHSEQCIMSAIPSLKATYDLKCAGPHGRNYGEITFCFPFTLITLHHHHMADRQYAAQRESFIENMITVIISINDCPPK